MGKDYRNVQKFIGMIVGGSVLAVLVGMAIDKLLYTTPLIMIVLLLYVVIGSMIWLVRSVGRNKNE